MIHDGIPYGIQYEAASRTWQFHGYPLPSRPHVAVTGTLRPLSSPDLDSAVLSWPSLYHASLESALRFMAAGTEVANLVAQARSEFGDGKVVLSIERDGEETLVQACTGTLSTVIPLYGSCAAPGDSRDLTFLAQLWTKWVQRYVSIQAGKLAQHPAGTLELGS